MLVKHNYIPKKDVIHCYSNESAQEVLDKLYKSGYRCIPVLDKESGKYVGMIYKVHLLELDEAEKGNSISALVREQEAFINEEESFLEVFFNIRRLPFLSVVDENNVFLGILPHSVVIDFLEDSLGNKGAGAVMTIGTSDYRGAMGKILRVVNKFSDIKSAVSLDSDSVSKIRRIIVALPQDITKSKVAAIKKKLEEKGFRVVITYSK